MSKTDSGTSRTVREGRKVPYVLAIPALAFMFVFFVVPIISLLKSSLSNKPNRLIPHYDFTWEWSNYRLAYDRFLGHFERSFLFAGLATLLCIVIAYPVAYFIAFKVGKWRNVLLGLVMVPFFTSFLLRTLAWQSLLADHGPVLGFVKRVHLTGTLEWLGILDNGAVLNSPLAVIGGLTYNFLPFMLLPIYVSLEKIDRGLIDAAADLYSPFGSTFRKVIMPLSLPGVFAGTLLTFIPATGDFINAYFLGGTDEQKVIGKAVQTQFLNNNDYPAAAGLSFVLMAIITALVLVYTKFMGTEDLA